MKYFQIVAAIAFAFFVSANAQGDEVFIRNVCDTLASKGHDPVTLVATDLIETKWVASKKSGNWDPWDGDEGDSHVVQYALAHSEKCQWQVPAFYRGGLPC